MNTTPIGRVIDISENYNKTRLTDSFTDSQNIIAGRAPARHNHFQGMMEPENFEMSSSAPPPMPPRIEYQSPARLHCTDVYDHIVNCPICRKMYNLDNSMYLIIIAILTLIIIVLMKKLLDKSV